MAGIFILRMTILLAMVNIAVEGSTALVGTIEHAGPLLDYSVAIVCGMLRFTCDFISTIAAKDSLFNLSTIATCIDSNFAGTAQAFVTWSRTIVLAAWHDVLADFSTAPTVFIVGIDTPSGVFVLAAKAYLGRPHVSAWWTRTSMTGELTWMWAFPNSFLSTTVSAGVRRQACQ